MENEENVEKLLQEIEREMAIEQETPKNLDTTEEKAVNYDVYNGLNLLSEELGQSYLTEGFNPFGSEFTLDESFVLDVLENNVERYEIVAPDFIEAGSKETAKAFELAAENALKVIELLNEHINDPKTPEMVKNQMRKQILYILCRNQLIRVYLKRIKDEKDTLAMYQKMSAINWQLSKTLENSYKKQFDAKRAAEELAQKAKKAAEAEENRPKYLSNRAQNILNKNKLKAIADPLWDLFAPLPKNRETTVSEYKPTRQYEMNNNIRRDTVKPDYNKILEAGSSFVDFFNKKKNNDKSKGEDLGASK